MDAAVHQLTTAGNLDREFIVAPVQAQLCAVAGHLCAIEQYPGSHRGFNPWQAGRSRDSTGPQQASGCNTGSSSRVLKFPGCLSMAGAGCAAACPGVQAPDPGLRKDTASTVFLVQGVFRRNFRLDMMPGSCVKHLMLMIRPVPPSDGVQPGGQGASLVSRHAMHYPAANHSCRRRVY